MTRDELSKIVQYSPETGHFTWVGCGAGYMNGRRAGSRQKNGYRKIGIRGELIYEHRLAFLAMGVSLPHHVDHINRVRDCNEWSNLRAATPSQNHGNMMAHNKSGVRGVYWEKRCKRWRAQLGIGQKRVKKLGSFLTIEEAKSAYEIAAMAYFGEHFAP